ncbi:MAG: MaoC family dehydratase [Candidatus Limnocylindrales bacterium]
MSGRYLEDFTVGEVIQANETYEMTPERVHEFAFEYDPQPIHLDPDAAASSMFGAIIASGWHSLTATMRLIVRSNIFDGAPVVGVGIDNLRYLKPVYPGDVLRAEAEVLETRPSVTKPERGYLRLQIRTYRENGEQVLTQDWTVLAPRRPK